MRRLATGLWSATIVLVAASLAMFAASWGIALPDSWGFRGFQGIGAMTAGTVGLLIIRRHPRHPVGWLWLGTAMSSAVYLFSQEYLVVSFYALREPLPAAVVIGWLATWVWGPGVLTALLVPLYFPDGRLPSPRWRWLPLLGAAAMTVMLLGYVADADLVAYAMRGVPPPYDPQDLGPLATYGRILYFAGGLVGVTLALFYIASVALRFGRARGVERQQIKWFALSTAVVVLTLLFFLAASAWSGLDPTAPAPKAGQILYIVANWLVPVSVGIAILRHRLFDIDVIISRALVYTALSAMLVGAYAAAVILFQAVLRPFTAGSDLAVAASTLVVVALFQPLRRRIQDLVDRRFYRSRYDAARTLAAFTTRLRSEVDVDSVRADLVDVLRDTFSPAHASVWLRGVRRP